MASQILPWLVVALLSGIVLGLIIGVALGSSLVKGHYSHFVRKTQPPQPSKTRPLVPPPPANQAPYCDDFPYDDRRNYPRY